MQGIVDSEDLPLNIRCMLLPCAYKRPRAPPQPVHVQVQEHVWGGVRANRVALVMQRQAHDNAALLRLGQDCMQSLIVAGLLLCSLRIVRVC